MEGYLEVKLLDDLANALISITTAFASLWIVNRYLNIFFKKKKNNLVNIILWTIFGIFQILMGFYSGTESIGMFLLNLIIVVLIALNSFEQARNKKIIIVVLLFLFWMLIEILCYFFLRLLPIGNMSFGILGSVISKLITILFVEVLNINFNSMEKETIPVYYYLQLLIIPLGSAFIAHNIFVLSTTNHIITTVVTFSILLLINVVIFEIYRKLAASFVIQKENIVYEQQMELLTINTEVQKKSMEDFYEDKHNLINQLVVLRECIKNNNKQDAIKELELLIQDCSIKTERILDSGNKVVDAIINFKYSIAKEKRIDMKLKIFIPEALPIRQCDLGIILGNSLDNAIEATDQCKQKDKIINVYMGIKKSSVIIVISNPFQHNLKIDKNGKLMTTKLDNKKHGYGISSISKVVEKYRGEIILNSEAEIFSLTVIINIDGI